MTKDLSQETVEELVRSLDDDALGTFEFEAYSEELEVALAERSAKDALLDLQSYIEATPAQTARERSLQAALTTLERVLKAAEDVVKSDPDDLFEDGPGSITRLAGRLAGNKF